MRGDSSEFTYENLELIDGKSVDMILHVGAAIPIREKPKPDFDYLTSNLETTKKLANWATCSTNAHFFYVSTSHLKEFCNHTKTISSLESVADIEIEKYYLSKYSCEIFLKHIKNENRIPVSIIRIATPISDYYCGSKLINNLIKNTREQRTTDVFVELDEILNLTWMEDLIRSIDGIYKFDSRVDLVDLVSSSSTINEIAQVISNTLRLHTLLKESSEPLRKKYERRLQNRFGEWQNFELTNLAFSLSALIGKN